VSNETLKPVVIRQTRPLKKITKKVVSAAGQIFVRDQHRAA